MRKMGSSSVQLCQANVKAAPVSRELWVQHPPRCPWTNIMKRWAQACTAPRSGWAQEGTQHPSKNGHKKAHSTLVAAPRGSVAYCCFFCACVLELGH
eukprot:1158839-Pelagomonas_calceolata.AAC.14